MKRYVFSLPSIQKQQVTGHWNLVAMMSSDEDPGSYIAMHDKDGTSQFHVVNANSDWEARANMQLGIFES